MYKWTARVNVEIADLWVADGFDLTPERAEEIFTDAIDAVLTTAHGHERKVSVSITRAPDPKAIRKEQGYEAC